MTETLPDSFHAICRNLWIRPHYRLSLNSSLELLGSKSIGSQGETDVTAQGYC